MTGTIVQRISIGVLWVVREGVGLARALKRTIQMSRSASTKADIAAMTQSRKKWKPATSCITGDAASCKSISHGVGWPSPAHAALALANTPPALAAIAAKRDNAFMPRPAPLLLIWSQPS